MLSALVQDYITTRARLDLVVDPDEPFDEQRALEYLEHPYNNWRERREYFDRVSSILADEIYESLYLASRDSLEYFYLGKIETFLKITKSIDLHTDEMVLSNARQSCKDARVITLIDDLIAVTDAIDLIRTDIVERSEQSLILAKYPDKFPELTSYAEWIREHNDYEIGWTKELLGSREGSGEVEELQESDNKLSAPQRVLFIRLLQEVQLFPKRPHNTDDAPFLRAIALMTGLDY